MSPHKFAGLVFGLAALASIGVANAAGLTLDRGDTRFLQKAAQNGRLEVDASKLALERALDAEVKAFAQKMVAEHSALALELETLAKAKKVELPSDLTWGQDRTMKKLQERTGRDRLHRRALAVKT